jgi:outer membrane protein OmpA-like peptidoglycan-associated protein
MSFNLLDTVKGLFSDNLVSTTAASLGESETGIRQALSGAIPSVLAGLLGKAESHEGAAGILDLAKQAAGSNIINNLGGFFSSDGGGIISKGAEMLKGLLGDKAGGIATLIANFAGIKHSSASSVLSMAAPAALGALGTHAGENNLNAGSLMNLLSSQKSSILSALPTGLSTVASVLGIGSNNGAVTAKASHDTGHDESGGTDNTMKFLLPLLLGILAVAAAIYLFKGCGTPKAEKVTVDSVAVKAEPVKQETATAGEIASTKEMTKVKLPNDTILNAFKGGIEDKLVAFLGTDYKKLGEDSLKKVWFDFDNLNFKTGSAELTAESQQQVDNIAAILKAFPAVKLKIGGYTDKVGDEAANKKLSDARAKSVQAALAKAGVGAQITGAEGYGSAFAVYPADAAESDRIKDRHVSVSVR